VGRHVLYTDISGKAKVINHLRINLIIRMKIFLIMLLLSSCQSKGTIDKACLKEIRTGKFAYEGRYGQDVEIIRTKDQQVEIINKGKSKQILEVKWTSETTYILTLREVVNSKPCLKIGETINVTVVKCDGKRYLAKYSSERCGKGESTFIKIE
jgi:hypothetical protein